MLNKCEEKIKTPKLYTRFAQTTDTKLIETDFSTRSQGRFNPLGAHAPSLWGPPLPLPSLFSLPFSSLNLSLLFSPLMASASEPENFFELQMLVGEFYVISGTKFTSLISEDFIQKHCKFPKIYCMFQNVIMYSTTYCTTYYSFLIFRI
jgi:hypothetical protein